MNVSDVELREVGPREGFQFEGIGDPSKISSDAKLRLVTALTKTGLKRIQVTSFVSPKYVPQMGDAEVVSRSLPQVEGVKYNAVVLNDKGLARALATGRYDLEGTISFTASDTFSIENQHRNHQQDVAMQIKQIELYKSHNIPVTMGSIMAAFGCNYEGDIPLEKVIALVSEMHDLSDQRGTTLERLRLADTMGWADPEMIKRTVGAICDRWPDLDIMLHLHDTRGTAMANVYAGLEMGVAVFETSVGGLGGCPFAKTVAGNVPTEDVAFMCARMGIATGIDLEAIVECARLAEEIVGHQLPSRLARVGMGRAAA